MIHKQFIAGLVFFTAALCGFAQNAAPGDAIFSPFVTRLTAETRNNLVRLSWVDSRDVQGPVYVFRSAHPFTGTNPSDLRPVELPYGSQSYVDETEGSGGIYYFVAASDTSGQRYDIFIPFYNTVVVNFPEAPPREAAPPLAPAGEAAPFRPAGVTGIEARAQGEGVVVAWQLMGTGRNAVLYRSSRPIRQTQDLLSAVIIQSGGISPFVDYPGPGTVSYYAVVLEDELTRGGVNIHPGINATLSPVETAAAAPARPGIRPMPLPPLSVYTPGGDYSGLPSPVPLSESSAHALRNVPPARSAPVPKRPRAFSGDLEAPAGGEESGLRSIVQGPFLRRDWQIAQAELLRYLSMPHSANVEARARFYLGQTYYYTGKNRESLVEFLFVQSWYPNEANEWIEAALAAIVQ
jgi:hypothetical protein